MLIKCDSFKNIMNHIIQQNKRIIMFGAGAIGKVVMPEILHAYNMDRYVECYIDNDCKKWGTVLSTTVGEINVFSPDILKQYENQNVVIFINVSRFSAVKDQLENMPETRKMECYFSAMLCLYNFEKNALDKVKIDDKIQKIPKVIHYIWLGEKEIPDALKKCMESWYKYCPDYEIKCWNEHNYNFEKNIYMKQAYARKAYGFVPDYARLDILYNYGGIYMDTDVELIKNIDDLLYQDAFCGVEKWQILNFGGCSGSVKGNKSIKSILDARETLCFINPDNSENRNTCGYYDTATAIRMGYKINGSSQKVGDLMIYSSDYFHPYDYMSGRTHMSPNTYSIHHFNGGWLNDAQRAANQLAIDQFNDLYNIAERV